MIYECRSSNVESIINRKSSIDIHKLINRKGEAI